jgi:3-phenylpropionate/trans-cinnamate dioxygenase ferredoxin component
MLTSFVPTIPDLDLQEGSMRGVKAGGDSILLARIDAAVYAISDICSHFHTNLSSGELIAEKCQVQCPLHNSCFDLRTGEPVDPQVEDPVETYGVKIGDGLILVGPPLGS